MFKKPSGLAATGPHHGMSDENVTSLAVVWTAISRAGLRPDQSFYGMPPGGPSFSPPFAGHRADHTSLQVPSTPVSKQDVYAGN